MKYLKQVLKKFMSDREITSLKDEKQALEYLKDRGISKDVIFKELENHFGFKSVDLKKINIDSNILSEFNITGLKAQNIIPYKFESETNTYYFATADPAKPMDYIVNLCRQKGKKAKFLFAFKTDIEEKINNIEKLDVTQVTDVVAVDWITQITQKGIDIGASDIHIEPLEYGAQVRYRIDGILSIKDVFDYSGDFIQSAISRLKIISGMNIAEKRRPQDGRIDGFDYNGEKYDMRASSVSTIHGEKVVLRIFNKDYKLKSLEALGFSGRELEGIIKMLTASSGVVYLAGATGSGKTTTLYAMINHINTDDISISTIEDPVESSIKGINQIQINSQLNEQYTSILKALLRQDPDVIVVGEVRDRDTAELCIRASLTGHLVLSTIHANNAIDTISRLYNMNIEPYLISSGALGFMSQKLIRVLCSCKQEAVLGPSERAWLDSMKNKYSGFDIGVIYEPKGCDTCNDIGYKGRTVIAEVVVLDEHLKDLIIKHRGVKEIIEEAKIRGFTPIELGGYKKVLEGVTSIKEIMRVT